MLFEGEAFWLDGWSVLGFFFYFAYKSWLLPPDIHKWYNDDVKEKNNHGKSMRCRRIGIALSSISVNCVSTRIDLPGKEKGRTNRRCKIQGHRVDPPYSVFKDSDVGFCQRWPDDTRWIWFMLVGWWIIGTARRGFIITWLVRMRGVESFWGSVGRRGIRVQRHSILPTTFYRLWVDNRKSGNVNPRMLKWIC